MRPHICLALKTRIRSVAPFAHGKAYRQAIGVRLIALLLLTRASPVLRISYGGFLDRRSFARMAIAFSASSVSLLAGGLFTFLKEAKFGGIPADSRLERIRRSPN